MTCFPLNYQTLIEIDVTPDAETSTYARVAKGFSSFDPSNNDVIDQTPYLDGEGFQSTDVTSAQYILALSGHRIYGDTAQDYIFGLLFELGCSRKTNLRMTDPLGNKKTGEITIANLDEGGGDAASKSEIGCEFHFNGKPTVTPKSAGAALSTVIAAGVTVGTTTATATATGDNTLAYKLSAATEGVLYAGQYVSGETVYTSGAEIEASIGQFLLVMELDGNNRLVGYSEHTLAAGDIAS